MLIAVKTDTEATSRGVGCVVRTAEGLMFCGLTALEESDRAIVPMRLLNKAGQPSAETEAKGVA
jgi:hypothetical protein